MSSAGRVITFLIIGGGLFVVQLTLQRFIQLSELGYFIKLEELRLRRLIRRMKNHVIICGYGRTGKEIANQLKSQRISALIIEIDNSRKIEAESKGFNVPIKPILSYQNQFDRLISDIKVKIKSGVVIVVSSYLNRIKELFQEYEIPYDVLTDQTKGIKKNIVTIVEGNLKEGLVIEQNEEVLILSDNEIFGFSKQRNIIVNENKTRGVSSVSLDEFSINSFVVHIDHGIGKFIGTTVMSEYGDGEEYMVLQYADKGKIYVPTHMSHRVSLYKGSNGSNPSLSRLSTMEWKRTKAQVEEDTLEIAKDLLDLYAQRNLAKGKSFPSDSLWQKELEDSFPYIETEDQIRVINEVKEDMESSTPMDRLICGDVGFGKTEVALRSAFKAVDSGSQVIILVPTTVLATQHFETFVNRLKPYPITVKMLSRLVPVSYTHLTLPTKA